MKKIIIAPDSFKETFTSIEVASLIKEELLKKYNYDFKVIPISDGGEGTLEVLEYSGVIDLYSCEVTGPNFEKVISKIGFFKENKKIAIIESAEVVGFKNQKNDSKANNTTTFGIGELIKIAVRKNVEKIYISLGGTITNDGGCGMLASLGVKFYKKKDKEFIPTGNTLIEIERIDISNLQKHNVEIICLTDVNNPLLGKLGATYVYAKQKRANEDEILQMEQGMVNYSMKSIEALNLDKRNAVGSGAAGGLGFALVSYLNAKAMSGIDAILEFIDFESQVKDSFLVITGEGKLDEQSFYGKAISGVINRAKKYDVGTILVVGMVEQKNIDLAKVGISSIYQIADKPKPIEEIKKTKIEDLKKTISKIIL